MLRERSGALLSVSMKARWMGLALAIAFVPHSYGSNVAVIFQSTETPPFWSETMPDGGLGAEILRLLSNEANIDFSINYLPIKRFRASNGAFLVGDPAILTTELNRAIFPIGAFHSAYFYYRPHHDTLRIHDLKDLAGLNVGVMRGTIENINVFLQHQIDVTEGDSNEALMHMLKKGRIDIAILVDLTGQYLIQSLFPQERDNFAQSVLKNSTRPIAIMIDLDAPNGKATAQRYHQVLHKTLSSDRYTNILQKYYFYSEDIERVKKTLDRLVEFYVTPFNDLEVESK